MWLGLWTNKHYWGHLDGCLPPNGKMSTSSAIVATCYMQNRDLLWPPAEDLRSLCMVTLHWSINESLLGQGQAVAEWFSIEIPSYHGIKALLVGDVRLLMVKVVLSLSIANSSYSKYLLMVWNSTKPRFLASGKCCWWISGAPIQREPKQIGAWTYLQEIQ